MHQQILTTDIEEIGLTYKKYLGKIQHTEELEVGL